MMMVVSDSGKEAGTVRPTAVAGAFYPANAGELQAMIDRQMNHARRLVSSLAPRLPQGAPKAVIVPHAGYVYSGSVAAFAYALLERGRGVIRRAVIIGPAPGSPCGGSPAAPLAHLTRLSVGFRSMWRPSDKPCMMFPR